VDSIHSRQNVHSDSIFIMFPLAEFSLMKLIRNLTHRCKAFLVDSVLDVINPHDMYCTSSILDDFFLIYFFLDVKVVFAVKRSTDLGNDNVGEQTVHLFKNIGGGLCGCGWQP